jgi:hypothetical protein
MLPHAVYFDTLGSITDESSQEWKATTAGLVVLRLVDDWFEFGPHIVTTDVTGLAAVRYSIAQVSEGNPIRALLEQVVNALMDADNAEIRVVTPPLYAYAQALQYAGHFSLEQDVVSTLNKYAKSSDDIETVILTSLRLGVIARSAGDFALAEQYHLAAEEQAQATGDLSSALLARIGFAKTTASRGDIGRADTMLAEIVEESEQAGIALALGSALHDRAHMAYMRDDIQGMIRFAHRALEHMTTPSARDRVMADIATGFLQLGHVAASRDTYLILASCAEEQIVRWRATISLMWAAVRERQEDAFELYRAALACIQLPVYEEIHYRWVAAEGFRLFGDSQRSEEELVQAHSLAEKYKMQKFVFELEQELRQAPVGEWTSDIDSIAIDMGERLRFSTLSMA